MRHLGQLYTRLDDAKTRLDIDRKSIEVNPGLTSVRAEIKSLEVEIDDLTKQLERQKALCADVGKYSQFIRDVKANMAHAQQGLDVANAEYEKLESMHDLSAAGRPPSMQPTISSGATRVRHFVMLVIAPDGGMSFQGTATNWDKLPALLEQVPDRSHTVLCLAWTSDQVTVGQLNEARVGQLAQQFGFEYLSNVGEHPLGARGGPDKLIAEVQAAPPGGANQPTPAAVNQDADKTITLHAHNGLVQMRMGDKVIESNQIVVKGGTITLTDNALDVGNVSPTTEPSNAAGPMLPGN
ncbi:MAG: hypothetical protein ABSD28_02030 [Tepidisphaeraceae bacterium]|jgi:hypothetical protein